MMLSVLLPAALVALTLAAPPRDAPHWLNMDGPASTDDILKFQPMTSLDDLWKFFKMEHNKQYAHAVEERVRREIFAENLKQIEMHNYLHSKGLKSYTMGVNRFTDLEHSEFAKLMGGYRPGSVGSSGPQGATYMSPLVPTIVPKSVDWRTKGYVTPVKNQGNCGSCWAFSTTGALEGQMFRKTGKLVSLSEQNLVDCSKENSGCNGGLMDLAFQYVKDNGGIDTEASYPYVGDEGDHQCHFNASSVGGSDVGFVDIQAGNETQLTEALATIGPVSVAIDADSALQHYKGGIFDEWNCSQALNHGVLAVGYGTEDGKDFYIVKNSWGENWGEKGYVRMTRNKKDQCGIAAKASYPLV